MNTARLALALPLLFAVLTTVQHTSEAATADTIQPTLSYSYYIATGSFEGFSFTLSKRMNVQMVLNIDNTVPLDVLTFPAVITKEQYGNMMANLAYEQSQDMMEQVLGKGARLTPRQANMPTEQQLFGFPLAKKGAYVHWESGWQVLDGGVYTVVLDNQGTFSPTRGDAPVQVLLYSAPAP